jgi:hypothetical protein
LRRSRPLALSRQSIRLGNQNFKIPLTPSIHAVFSRDRTRRMLGTRSNENSPPPPEFLQTPLRPPEDAWIPATHHRPGSSTAAEIPTRHANPWIPRTQRSLCLPWRIEETRRAPHPERSKAALFWASGPPSPAGRPRFRGEPGNNTGAPATLLWSLRNSTPG